jgi:predicted RNA binding protein YcfA (HicA-like mRNA interferase family)
MSRLPSVRPRQVVAVLRRLGFIEHHQRGSHLFLWHPQAQRMATVPIHPRDLKLGTLKAILKQAGVSEEQFRELLWEEHAKFPAAVHLTPARAKFHNSARLV